MLIGMNVELGDSFSNALTQQANEVSTQLGTVSSSVHGLLDSWSGNSRAIFEQQWEPWATQVQSLVSQMEDMQRRLAVTIEGFRAADTF